MTGLGTSRIVRRAAIALLLAVPLLGGVLNAATLDAVMARMDQTAATFKSMSAKIRRVQHTAVINEDDASEGTIRMRRTKRDLQFLADLTSPDIKSVAVSGAKVEIFYPKLNLVQEYDLGKVRVEKFLALGFGASGKELKDDYAVRLLGEETVNGDKAARLELIPKSPEVLKQFPRIELWISEDKGYPLQEKLHQTGGDYQTVVFTEAVINPALPDSSFKLNLPKGVKRETPQK